MLVVQRDALAAHLVRSESPPDVILRTGAAGLETSPLLGVPFELGIDLPPLVVLLPEEDRERLDAIAEPGVRLVPLTTPLDRRAFDRCLESLNRAEDDEPALLFEGREPGPERHLGWFVGESAVMHRVYRMLEKTRRSDATVLITGESGTGKELAARVVHELSDRRAGPLVTVNCGAIPENLIEAELFGFVKGSFTGAHRDAAGRFREADGGTLFLDELGELPLDMQVKLLRALQEGEIRPLGSSKVHKVDVRLVCATNRDLKLEVDEGRFREDLYYRVHVLNLHLPPLRDRPEDIPLLIRACVAETPNEASPALGLGASALKALMAYDWKGNVRELRSAITKMRVLSDNEILGVDDLPASIRVALDLFEEEGAAPPSLTVLPPEGVDLAELLREIEDALITQALERTGWNKKQAAELLRMKRTTLVEKIRKRGLEPD